MADVINRRTFLHTAAAAGIGVSLPRPLASWKGLDAPNERIRVAVMGVNGRGHELAKSFARASGAEVAYICDVDERATARAIKALAEYGAGGDPLQALTPKGVTDFRRALDDADVDALVIAAPDHWHAPASILALQAGKHVYVEKPCGHNAREGEMLVEAQAKYGRVVQMGNQQRSAPRSIEVIQAIHEGVIGRPYFARAWYANTRGSIGTGKEAPVPDWLDYELWQGPAPRTPYRDNVVHYNWHWFWDWGTGEICNNGTHEIDVARWALGVDYPVRVSSSGGRYHFDDDWEAYDTQVAAFDFDEGKSIIWEGRSCNGYPIEGRGRGVSIHGEGGTVIMDRDGYIVYDNERKEIRRNLASERTDALDTRGGGSMTDLHIENFLAACRGEATQHSEMLDSHKSVLLCHLGNIAQQVGQSLHCDPATGHILGHEKAMALWGRAYADGWAPTL